MLRSVDPTDLAREILSEDRFQPVSSPSAARRPLAWLGEKILSVLSPIGRFFAQAFQLAFNAPVIGLIMLAFFGFVVVLIVRSLQSRRRVEAAGKAHSNLAESTDPKELERQAEMAARNGNFAEAVRLRYLAGLRRLELHTDVSSTQVSPNGKLRNELQVSEFDQLTDDFDQIVYGDRQANRTDDEAAQQRWPQVQGEAQKRRR